MDRTISKKRVVCNLKAVDGKALIKNRRTLTIDYVPEKLPFRDEETKLKRISITVHARKNIYKRIRLFALCPKLYENTSILGHRLIQSERNRLKLIQLPLSYGYAYQIYHTSQHKPNHAPQLKKIDIALLPHLANI